MASANVTCQQNFTCLAFSNNFSESELTSISEERYVIFGMQQEYAMSDRFVHFIDNATPSLSTSSITLGIFQ